MLITEIFRSLQGESSYTGLPCVFVRLTGCNLRCSWCDTEYSFYGGRRMSLAEVIAEIQILCTPEPNEPPISYPTAATRLVEITGGEPMLQEQEVVPLMEELLAGNFTVLLETSGERPLARVPAAVVKIVDVKCPASGAGASFHLANLDALTSRDEVKFVIADRADYEFAREFVHRHHLPGRAGTIIFSPAFAKTAAGSRDTSNCLLDPQPLAEWILRDRLPVRLGLQIHKFIWDPATKGV